jgi:hypothetical protein
MAGDVVISEVDAHMYVVLSKAEKHVPYGELVGTIQCTTLKTRCHTNGGRYNRVQLSCIKYLYISLLKYICYSF